jgi:penicillin-binding protein 1A
MARKMGVVSPLHSYAAEALGGLTIGVTPLEMANVYATLADGGWRNTPIAITKVVFPNGHTDSNWGQPHRVKVLSEAVTSRETQILEQNVQSGTAVRSAINCPTAAKTGTTEELVDAWLDGFTPDYSTVVWMGYPNRRVPMTSVHGEPQQGGALPANIWHDYMSAVTEGKPCVPFRVSSESLSYQPFFGKYSTTGRGEAPGTGEGPTEPESRARSRRAAPRTRGGGPQGGSRGEQRIAPPRPPPPAAPAPPAHGPPSPAPGQGPTGGAPT